MKSIHLLNFLLLLTFSFCLEKEEYKTEITFKKNEVKISKEEVVVEEGNVVVIEQPGSYYATGKTEAAPAEKRETAHKAADIMWHHFVSQGIKCDVYVVKVTNKGAKLLAQ